MALLRSAHAVATITLRCFLWAEKHFALAIAGYSKAIDLDPENAVYYANRAAAHLRLENYGSALSDASQAIEIDSSYVKVRRHCCARCCTIAILELPMVPCKCRFQSLIF